MTRHHSRFSGSTASSSSATTPPAISLVNDEMLNLASEIHSDVSNLIRSYSADRDRLKAAMEQLEYQVGALAKFSLDLS